MPIIFTINSSTPSADVVITSDAEWDAHFAQSTATIDGQIVEIDGALTAAFLSNHDFSSGITIRGAAGASVRNIVLSGVLSNVTFKDLKIQMTGWPRTTDDLVFYNGGTFTNIHFDGVTFRHGYGSSLIDTPIADHATMPELTSGGLMTFMADAFGRSGAANHSGCQIRNCLFVDVANAIKGAGIVDVVMDCEFRRVYMDCMNEVKASFRNLFMAPWSVSSDVGDPHGDVNQWFSGGGAIGTATTTSSSVAIAWPPFDAEGTVVFSNTGANTVHFKLGDSSVVATLSDTEVLPGASVTVTDAEANTHIAVIAASGTSTWSAPATKPVTDIIEAGSRTYPNPRGGAGTQGVFWSDVDTTPGFRRATVVNALFLTGSTHGITIGEVGFPPDDIWVYGSTLIHESNLGSNAPIKSVVGDGNYLLCQDTIAPIISEFEKKNSLELSSVGDRTTIFPNYSDLSSASNSFALIEAGGTSAGAGSAIGAVAKRDVIDWTTSDPDAVVKWDMLPSGAHWNQVGDLATSTVYTSPLRTILNRKASQAVVPGAGVEWRSTEEDGVTEVTAWTASSGTVGWKQKIQWRMTTSASAGDVVASTLSINGFEETVSTQTTVVLTDAFVMNGAYFRAPANIGAGVSRIGFEARLKFPTTPSTSAYLFSHESGNFARFDSNAALEFLVEALVSGVGTTVGVGPSRLAGLDDGLVHVINFDADLNTDTATVTLDGVEVMSFALTANDGTYASNREIVFGGQSGTGGGLLPNDAEVEYFKYFQNGTLSKEISVAALGSIAGINADAWTVGTVV